MKYQTSRTGRPIRPNDIVLCLTGPNIGKTFRAEYQRTKLIFTAETPPYMAMEDGIIEPSDCMHTLELYPAYSYSKPTKHKEYVRFLRSHNIDLADLGTSYCINKDELTDTQIAKLMWCGYNLDDELLYVESKDVAIADCANATTGETDYDNENEQYEAEITMGKLLKEANHYLVFAANCRYNGSSGYTITDDILKTIQRPYAVTIIPKECSKGGKTLICRESSHDVPMGAETTIIALTDKEYEYLMNASFEAVRIFTEQHALYAKP